MSFATDFWRSVTFLNFDQPILKQTKRRKNIIYGAQSIKAQTGFFARPTTDYDIYSKTPRRDAFEIQRTLDRKSRANQFYATPSKKHPGTWKVYSKGADHTARTRDDVGVADYTKPKREIKYVTLQGVRYARLSESVRDKQAALKDKEFSFRHEKDREDIERIRAFQNIRGNKK